LAGRKQFKKKKPLDFKLRKIFQQQKSDERMASLPFSIARDPLTDRSGGMSSVQRRRNKLEGVQQQQQQKENAATKKKRGMLQSRTDANVENVKMVVSGAKSVKPNASGLRRSARNVKVQLDTPKHAISSKRSSATLSSSRSSSRQQQQRNAGNKSRSRHTPGGGAAAQQILEIGDLSNTPAHRSNNVVRDRVTPMAGDAAKRSECDVHEANGGGDGALLGVPQPADRSSFSSIKSQQQRRQGSRVVPESPTVTSARQRDEHMMQQQQQQQAVGIDWADGVTARLRDASLSDARREKVRACQKSVTSPSVWHDLLEWDFQNLEGASREHCLLAVTAAAIKQVDVATDKGAQIHALYGRSLLRTGQLGAARDVFCRMEADGSGHRLKYVYTYWPEVEKALGNADEARRVAQLGIDRGITEPTMGRPKKRTKSALATRAKSKRRSDDNGERDFIVLKDGDDDERSGDKDGADRSDDDDDADEDDDAAVQSASSLRARRDSSKNKRMLAKVRETRQNRLRLRRQGIGGGAGRVPLQVDATTPSSATTSGSEDITSDSSGVDTLPPAAQSNAPVSVAAATAQGQQQQQHRQQQQQQQPPPQVAKAARSTSTHHDDVADPYGEQQCNDVSDCASSSSSSMAFDENDTQRVLSASFLSTVQHVDEKKGMPFRAARSERNAREIFGAMAKVVGDRNMFEINGKRYFRLCKIGKGGSSRVYKVMDECMELRAVKIVDLAGVPGATIASYRNEIDVLHKLRAKPNIIHLYDSQTSDKYIALVLEYAEADLQSVLSNLRRSLRTAEQHAAEHNESPSQAHACFFNYIRLFWQQMLLAVHTIHTERIVHGDLKPANFVCHRGTLKLIDFGIASQIVGDTTNIVRPGAMGTINYIAPEAVIDTSPVDSDSNEHRIKVGRASDIWSLGIILYQMCFDQLPFAAVPLRQRMHAIANPNHRIPFPSVHRAPPSVVDVLKRCLIRDPRRRITIPQLLNHDFMLNK
jgi:serine/threonine-protein kinase TTK/MPS1